MTALPQRVTLVEVGPRDGLQNESAPVPTDVKLKFIAALAAAGLTHIEATAFVHPKVIPQLADADEVARRLPRREPRASARANTADASKPPTETPSHKPAVQYSALAPNVRGLERAIAAGIERVAVFTAASETFTQRNIRQSIAESIAAFGDVVRMAADAGISVRGYVSTAFVCPYEGAIAPDRVRDVTVRLLDIGVDEVAISDTLGAAVPTDIRRTIEHVTTSARIDQLALHLHDTYGTALANVYAGLEMGIRTFDAAAGGFGGCPFAPGAAGNLATEDLVYMLDGMGITTGVDLTGVVAAAGIIAKSIGREPTSRQWRRLRCAEKVSG